MYTYTHTHTHTHTPRGSDRILERVKSVTRTHKRKRQGGVKRRLGREVGLVGGVGGVGGVRGERAELEMSADEIGCCVCV